MIIKAEIVVVGTFDENDMPTGWTIDCANGAIGMDLGDPVRLGGYTIAELHEIAAQNS